MINSTAFDYVNVLTKAADYGQARACRAENSSEGTGYRS